MNKFFNKFLLAAMLIVMSFNVGATDFSIVYIQPGKVPYLLAETDQGYRFGIGHTEQSITCMDLKFMVLDIYPKDALKEQGAQQGQQVMVLDIILTIDEEKRKIAAYPAVVMLTDTHDMFFQVYTMTVEMIAALANGSRLTYSDRYTPGIQELDIHGTGEKIMEIMDVCEEKNNDGEIIVDDQVAIESNA
jgi:hypothetical protein